MNWLAATFSAVATISIIAFCAAIVVNEEVAKWTMVVIGGGIAAAIVICIFGSLAKWFYAIFDDILRCRYGWYNIRSKQ